MGAGGAGRGGYDGGGGAVGGSKVAPLLTHTRVHTHAHTHTLHTHAHTHTQTGTRGAPEGVPAAATRQHAHWQQQQSLAAQRQQRRPKQQGLQQLQQQQKRWRHEQYQAQTAASKGQQAPAAKPTSQHDVCLTCCSRGAGGGEPACPRSLLHGGQQTAHEAGTLAPLVRAQRHTHTRTHTQHAHTVTHTRARTHTQHAHTQHGRQSAGLPSNLRLTQRRRTRTRQSLFPPPPATLAKAVVGRERLTAGIDRTACPAAHGRALRCP